MSEYLREAVEASRDLLAGRAVVRHVVKSDLEALRRKLLHPAEVRGIVAGRAAGHGGRLRAADRPYGLRRAQAEIAQEPIHVGHVLERCTVGVVEDREREAFAVRPADAAHGATTLIPFGAGYGSPSGQMNSAASRFIPDF